MTPRARMLEALSPAARAMVGEYIDPAEAWLAAHDGLTAAKANNRARNARRFGRNWPDASKARWSFVDVGDCENLIQPSGFFGICPLQILEAIEAAEAALDSDDALQNLDQATAQEISTDRAGAALGLSKRRAEQMKKAALKMSNPLEFWANQIQSSATKKMRRERLEKAARARARRAKNDAQMTLFPVKKRGEK